MSKRKIEQENLCLQIKYLSDLLRTKLFQLDDFKDYEFYSKKLKKLKQEVDKIYWSI